MVKFDRATACWQAVGKVDDLKSEGRRNLLDVIKTLQDREESPTTKRLAEERGLSSGYVSQLLGDLVAEGKVVKSKKIGKEQPYFLPGTDVSKWYESSNDGEDQEE